MASLGDKVLDKRIIERNIAKGLVTKDRFEQYLIELPDREGAYERIEIEPEESSEDDSGAE